MPEGEKAFNPFLKPERAPNNAEKEAKKMEIIASELEPVVPEDDASIFVVTANADIPSGEFTPGERENTQAHYQAFFNGIFKDLSPEDRAKVDILVIAGDTNSRTPQNEEMQNLSSLATADQILEAAMTTMKAYEVDSKQLLNKKKKPIELASGKLSASKEEDPDEIADRISDYMATLTHAMYTYHLENPERKAVVVLALENHSAENLIKKYVLQQPADERLTIEPNAGVVIESNIDGELTTTIQDKEYPVEFVNAKSVNDALKAEQEFIERFFQLNPSEKMTPEEMLEKLKNEPLERKEVEKVVDEFLETHVQHKHGQILFAGSGSGKSTTARNQIPNAEGKRHLVDADFVYRATGAHPLLPTTPGRPIRTFPWWYMGDDVIMEVEKRCGLVNEVMVEKGLWALTSSFDLDDSYLETNLVIAVLPLQQHAKNIRQKFGEDRGKYDGGVRLDYHGLSIAKSHRKFIRDVVLQKFDIPVVDSIEKAIEIFRERENS